MFMYTSNLDSVDFALQEFVSVKFLTSATVFMVTLEQGCLEMLYVQEIKQEETKKWQ